MTLLGPGGVGKTRMLGEIGRRLRAERPDRPVVMCELATADEESVVDVVAAALGIEGRPDVGLADRVAAVLGDTEIALLLDNCEHVLGPVAELVERLLATCPNVRLVATSRERLRVAGEQLCIVPTLGTSSDGAPAVQLFVERAGAVAPGFDPGAGRAGRHRRDRPPARWVAAGDRAGRSPPAHARRRRGRRRPGSPLRAAVVRLPHVQLATGRSTRRCPGRSICSIQRCSAIFADLSVFAAPFTAAAAAAICGVDADTATIALDQLVERSLVMRAPERRFVLLETLRAFGAEQLDATGRATGTGERHARHFVEWVEDADRRLAHPADHPVLAEIDDALPELRTALGWLLDHSEVDLAGRLVAALLDYGFLRLRPDVQAWADRVTDCDPEGRSPLSATAWAVSAHAAWMAGNLARPR